MADVVDKATRSRMMSGIRGKDTAPEIFLRKALHGMGFRYRLGGCGLPGKPDLVFPSRRTVVFVHGCFWHKHECQYFKWPSSNVEFWKEKLEKNAARDKQVQIQLIQLGWNVLIVWECELRETHYSMPNQSVHWVSEKLRKI